MKKRNRIFAVVIISILAFGMVACGASKKNTEKMASVDETGADGGNAIISEDYFEWSENIITGLTEEGAKQTSIRFPARCEGFDGMIFKSKENSITEVSFESDTDIMLDDVFAGAINLKKIILPMQLTTISALEFDLCTSLESITIPSGVTIIGDNAFQGNTALKEVIFEGSVEVIEQYAFYQCESLSKIVLPDTITRIGKYAFNECKSLTEITLPEALSEVGMFTFGNNGLIDIYVPSNFELLTFESTSFVQSNHTITIHVVEGSLIDENFEDVFDGNYTKDYNSGS